MQLWLETTAPIEKCKVSFWHTRSQPNSTNLRTHTGWLLARLRKVQNGLRINGNILRCQVWSGKRLKRKSQHSSFQHHSPPALAVSNDSFWMKLWWMTVLWTQERMIIGGCHPVDGWIQKSCNVIWHDESDSSLRDDGRCTKYVHFGAGVLNLGADSARGTVQGGVIMLMLSTCML